MIDSFRTQTKYRWPISFGLLVILSLWTLPALATDSSPPALPESGLTFYGADDRPLSLSEDELLRFLEEAPITKTKVLSSGINRTRKLTLEDHGISVNAVFRTVDKSVADTVGSTRPNRFGFKDCYLYEVAAYRLSRMLGIHRVPPAVLREIDGERGSVQLWIENSTTAAEAVKSGLAYRHPAKRHLQRQLMYGFDQLVYNFDRNMGNILYDQRDRLWFIDHTRAFKRLPTLTRDQLPTLSDRTFYAALTGLDPTDLRAQMKGVLSKIELDALLRRRTRLLRHFDNLIQEHGTEAVIVDVSPTVPASAPSPFSPTAFGMPSAMDAELLLHP